MRLEGKRVLITGGSHGIGKATALAFAREGARLAITYRGREQGARDTERRIGEMGREVHVIQAEVTNPDDCTRLVDEAIAALGGLDVVVNNAGGARGSDLQHLSLADWHYTLNLCVTAPFLVSQRAAQHMIEAGHGGAIISISSVHSTHVWASDAAYGVAKAALNRLTRSMALEWAAFGIRANAIAPGYIDIAETEAEQAKYDATDGKAASVIVAQRTGEPGEIAEVAAFLASDAASYVTGQTLFVDGGLLLPAITTADFMRSDRSDMSFTG